LPVEGDAAVLSSTLELAHDGTFVAVAGDAVTDAAIDGPRMAHGFLRRVGDEVPLVLGGASYSAPSLVAALARWVVDAAWARADAPAEQIALTHPTCWGGYRVEVLHRALTEAGLEPLLLSRARAVAESHAARGRLPAGELLAVYRLGGTGVETALLAQAGGGAFEVLTATELDGVGGADLRDAPEDQKQPIVRATVDALARAVRAGGAAPADVAAVLMAGGAAGAPAISELISYVFGCPVLCEEDPQFTAARGAALAARRRSAGAPPPPPDLPDYEEPTLPGPVEAYAPALAHPRRGLVPDPAEIADARPARPPVQVAELEAAPR
jgi:molecular chaperone DnaK (HSP70)